jgi:hypothetical protein
MGVNLDAMKRQKAEAASKRGGADYYTVPEGETLLYICPPLAGDDLPFVETFVHYDAGPEDKMTVCLDPERNPVLKDPRVQAVLAKRKKNIEAGCQACIRLDDGADVAREASSRYYWGIIPLKQRKDNTKKWREADDADELRILACGYTVWSGIMDCFINNGDISDPKKAILVVVQRKGKGMSTTYTVTADSDSVRSGGIAMSKPVRALVKNQCIEGENGDLYRVIANSVKSSAEVHSIIEGVPLEDDDDAGTSDDGKPPECFGLDFEDGDADCEACDHKADCQDKCGVPGKKPEPPKKPAKAKGKGKTKTKAVPEPAPEPEPEPEPEGPEVGDEVVAKDCVIGDWYAEDADDIEPMKYKGGSKKGKKHWAFFEDEDGERIRLKATETVTVIPAPKAGDDDGDEGGTEADDDDMAALEKAIADRKKGK